MMIAYYAAGAAAVENIVNITVGGNDSPDLV